MDWKTLLERWGYLPSALIVLFALSTLISLLFYGWVGWDPFWHLRTGQDWLEHGLSPWVDHYSYTFNGESIRHPPVAFQAGLHLVVSQLGLGQGFALVRLTTFVLVIGAAVLFLRQVKASALLYAVVVPMLVFLLQVRSLIRPELVSYVLSIVALMLYVRAGDRVTWRTVTPMVALMALWSLYHASVMGYVIFAGFFLDCAVAQARRRAGTEIWLQWLLWGLLMLAVGFLNPDFSHPLWDAATASTTREWKYVINEYLPPTAMVRSYAGTYALVVLALITPLLALSQRRYGFLLIWAVMTYSGVTMIRMMTPGGIVVVLLAATLLAARGFPLRWHIAGRNRAGLGVALCIALIAATLHSNDRRAQFFVDEGRRPFPTYPAPLVNYMAQSGKAGRIYNDYGLGGYLIYHLSPAVQVYIDGRTSILYPPEHMAKYVANNRSRDRLRAEVDKYGVNMILYRYRPALHDMVYQLGDFGLDFMDANYMLYTQGSSNFLQLGRLMAWPACWHPDLRSQIDVEHARLGEVLPPYSFLFRFGDFVHGYTNAEDGVAFLDQSVEAQNWTDEMRRFAGFRFLESGNDDLAAILFGSVEAKRPEDYLVSVLAKMNSGDMELASDILRDMAIRRWARITTAELRIQQKLFQRLEQHRALASDELDFTRRLAARLDELGVPDTELELDARAFCPDGHPPDFGPGDAVGEPPSRDDGT